MLHRSIMHRGDGRYHARAEAAQRESLRKHQRHEKPVDPFESVLGSALRLLAGELTHVEARNSWLQGRGASQYSKTRGSFAIRTSVSAIGEGGQAGQERSARDRRVGRVDTLGS